MGVIKNNIILGIYVLGRFRHLKKSRRLAICKRAMVSHLLPNWGNYSLIYTPQSLGKNFL